MENKKLYFKQIHEDSKDKIYRLCLGFMGNKSDADDLYQEVFIKIWKNLAGFRNESAIQTWIYRITTNTALLTLKKKQKLIKNKDLYDPHLENTATETQKEQHVSNLYKAIATLKEIDRIIIGLLLEDCSYSEIAKITGLKTSNVGVRINRIKKSLSKKIK